MPGSSIEWGVALGGGGVRGFAHLGVLRVLEHEGLAPQALGGTSMGAIVAALYATLPSLAAVETRLQDFFRRIGPEFLRMAKETAAAPGTISLDRPSLMDPVVFHEFFDELIPDVRFDQTRMPLAIVAVDLLTGGEIVYTSGPLRPAVLGSAALPGIFPPITHDSRVLIDGGWTSRIPVSATRTLGASRVVAVEVSEAPDNGPVPVPTTGLGIVLRAAEITRNHLARLQAAEADVLIRPQTGHILLHDVSSLLDCARLGMVAAKAALPRLSALRTAPRR